MEIKNKQLQRDKQLLAQLPKEELYWIQAHDVLRAALMKWAAYTNAGGQGGLGQERVELFVEAVCATRAALSPLERKG